MIAVAATVLTTAPSAFAQEPPEVQSSPIAGWSFTPGVTASSVFDSNVALAAEFPTRPDTQGDQLFVIAPSGQLEYHGPRTTFESGYRGYLRRYVDLDALNGFDQRGYASLRYRTTRHVTVFARDTYIKAPTTDELDLNGVLFRRTGARHNTFVGGIESRLTKHMDLNARYDMNWVDFDRTTTVLRSGFAQTFQTELARRLNDRSSLGAEYSLRLADLNQGTRHLTFQDVGGTFRYDSGPRTTLDAAAGLSYLIDRTFDDTRTGPYVRVGITHEAERAVVGANYSREFLPTFGFGGSSASESVRGYVRMPFDRNRLYVQESVTWRRSDPLIEETLALDSLWLHSTLGYAMSRWLRVEGFYVYTRQDTHVAGGQINRHRVGAQIAVSQPMRIR